MNCQEALNLLYDVIDKEASEIDVQQVREHLARCQDCAGVYRLEQSVNELLQEKLKHQDASPRLDALKAKILSQLDEVDCGESKADGSGSIRARKASGSGFPPGRALAIAAAVVIVLGAAFFGMSMFDRHTVYLPLEEAHWTASDNLDLYRNSVMTSMTRVDTQQRLTYDVVEGLASFELVGGQLETVDEIPLAHFVYQNRDHVVSVFVVDIARMPLPDDLVETMTTRNGIQFFDHNCPGCRLVFHQVGNALIVTATTHREVDLLDFVPDRGPV